MKKVFQHVIRGIGFGSATYLIILASTMTSELTISISSIWAILLMSAGIGLLSIIFESDRFSFLTLFVSHLFGTAFLVWLAGTWTNCFDMKMDNPMIWLNFLIAYAIIWGIIRFNQQKKISKINQALSKRHQQEKD
ncbi:DUF3021 domain-containing protein [Fructobacillus parabroussonetiae]|uniref:DUF3021 domain-containing protein n=1 Tax=Fructobacillus parabroussonetiae TaxID=2713174 RepID=A0ABS5QVX0_9LACO|nr:DUF3021 domain-containing protein [Fructobacillus parabroussonetiae]MBS9337353.1 DUF3021 domain-containing protein [Fructobacillus parabroussonetiae]